MNKIFNKVIYLSNKTFLNKSISPTGRYIFTNDKYNCHCCNSCNKFFNCDKVLIAFFSGTLFGFMFSHFKKNEKY